MKRDPFEARLEEALRRHAMVALGDVVLVGVSGGPDSMALLRGLWALAGDLEISLHVAHVDHGLRGAPSAADAEAVAGFAASLGLGFALERLDPARLAGARGAGGRQAAARRARLQALGSIAARVGARRVALGHNREDQAETVLMRLLRGAGGDGLAGIYPVRGLFIHPLLDVGRAEIEQYLVRCRLEPRRDLTNLRPVYLRNAVRLRLVPYIERRFNPRIVHSLATLARTMQEDADFLRDQARGAWDRVAAAGGPPGAVTLSLPAFRREMPAMQSRLAREAFQRASGSPYGPPLAQVAAVRRLAAGVAGGALDLSAGVAVRRAGDLLTFRLRWTIIQEEG